jgi:diguanylate cyclase (GGDEF)-like protein
VQLAKPRRNFARHIVVPTAGTIAFAALLIASLLLWSTRQADRIELERQQQLASFVVKESIAALGYQQEASTVWDESIAKVHASELDFEWLDNNLGVWLHTYYGHDEAYIFDPGGRAIYAMRAGKRVDPASSSLATRAVVPLSAELRKRLVADDYSTPEGAQSPGVTDLMIVNGHPAIISVKPIVTDTGKVPQVPGSEYFHASFRYLDGSFMEGLERNYWFKNARFERNPPDTRAFAALPLKARNGATIGHFSWRPYQPGAQIAAGLAPALVGSFLLVGCLSTWLLLWVRRITAELQASEAQAQHLAFHDALTGLPNRALFSERCDHALHEVRKGEQVALLLIDLDRFKNVNDSFGHVAGDALIRDFARRLVSIVRDCDTVARLGGDEFVVLLRDIRDQANAAEFCARVLGSVREPFDVLGNEAFVGASIGAVLAPESGTERVELLRKADIALYRAKNEGRNRYCFFTSSMDEGVKLRGQIEDELRHALASGEGLRVCYQAQTSASSGDVVGLEALVRWDNPVRGVIPPENFIPVAEDTGLICSLGEWVLQEAFGFSTRRPDLYVAVNLSPVQFRQPGFADRLLAIAAELGADPKRIQLEITEGVLLGNEDLVKDSLKALRDAGFKIALDDFGTGYSSLRYLRHFSVDKIKIDRTFVQHLGQQVDSAAIVSAVVTLGHAMGLTVTAEGVETREQERFLASIGCDEMQGYLFSRAVAEEQVAEMIADCRRGRLAA